MLHLPILQELLLDPHDAPSQRVEYPRRARGRTCLKRVWELCENCNPLRTAGRYELLASLNEMADRSPVSPLQQAAVARSAASEPWREAACWSGTKTRGVLKNLGLGVPLQGRERRTDHSSLFASRGASRDTNPTTYEAYRARRDTARQAVQHGRHKAAEHRANRPIRSCVTCARSNE